MAPCQPSIAQQEREYLPPVFASGSPPYGAGETGFPLPSLEPHHGRNECLSGKLQILLREEIALVQAPVSIPSTFTDCLSSLMEQRLYHKTNAKLTSSSWVIEMSLLQSRIAVSR